MERCFENGNGRHRNRVDRPLSPCDTHLLDTSAKHNVSAKQVGGGLNAQAKVLKQSVNRGARPSPAYRVQHCDNNFQTAEIYGTLQSTGAHKLATEQF